MSFPYDVETLIKLVEERPCLWDKSQEYYKSKSLMRHKAWIEIYHCLEDKYGELSNKEKKQVGMKITSKWVNIKDAFIKTLKKNSGHVPKRKYIYANHLQFLLNKKKESTAKRTANDLELKKEQEDHSDLILHNDLVFVNQDQSLLLKSPNRITCTRMTDNTDMQISEELESSRHHLLTSNDEKFFQSFVPYIRDMTENERINLQMDLLSLIKRIKENRQQNYSLKVTSQTWPTSDD